MRILAMVVGVLWAVMPAWAAVSLPTDGYYRPGRYMPVVVEPNGAEVVVSGPGVLTTRVAPGGGRVLVPVLVTGPLVGRLEAAGDIIEPGLLRPLEPGERLVAARSGEGRALFDESTRLVHVPVERLLSMPAPAAAWTVLDGVVLEQAEYAALPAATIDVLAAAGCAIAVRASAPPDARPWQSGGEWQVLRPAIAGPTRTAVGGALGEGAYAPTYAWQAGWSGPMRRNLLMVGMAIAAAAVSASAMRRHTMTCVLGVALLACGGVGAWWSRTAFVFSTSGRVIVLPAADRAGGDVQQDVWAYQTAQRDAEAAYLWRELTWPMFASERHREGLGMELRCAADGSPRAFAYRLPTSQVVAFLSRSRGDKPGHIGREARSPMVELVRHVYRGGYRVIDKGRGGAHELGYVVIQP